MRNCVCGIAGLLVMSCGGVVGAEAGLQFRSAYLRAELAEDRSGFRVLAVDSLGKRKLDTNLIMAGAAAGERQAAWAFKFSERGLTMHGAGPGAKPFAMRFDPTISHATLLGRIHGEGKIALPAVLHFPDFGSIRITASAPVDLEYDAVRYSGADRATKKDWVQVAFPATATYTWEIVAIYPAVKGAESDSRFDGFRRNFLNILQLNPRQGVLANHAASDPCALTAYMYADMAAAMPPLAPGLTALDLVRETLDRYLGGLIAYGMVGYTGMASGAGYRFDSMDTYPSLVIAASVYTRRSGDRDWARKHFAGIAAWMDRVTALDRDGGGMLEHPMSGNAGMLRVPVVPGGVPLRPSNWWDTIGFAHQDGYSNALAYRALREFAEVARMVGEDARAKDANQRADRLRSKYYDALYNPSTGVLAGWRSADGKLHDYYFPFVNGIAVTYGLVDGARAKTLMDHIMAKMRAVGYDRFDLGLPGNLIPVRQEDYSKSSKRWGDSQNSDGSDGFQIYENGGATACHAYFTLSALYRVGERDEADRILFPMLKAFEDGGFQGVGGNGMTKDWKAWDGTPHGYEGLLVDGYMALLAVVERAELK